MGRQKTKQLTHAQRMGRNKLMKRVHKAQIVVCPADKGKGLVVMPVDMYENMIVKHTEKDKEVKWKELEEAQRTVTS